MRRRARPGGGRQVELVVESVGAKGDGLAKHAGTPVFLALTLPGERVLARLAAPHPNGVRADVLELQTTSPDRVEPPCPHFGPCGGCQLQHFAPARYQTWKRAQVVEALQKRGFSDAERLVAPLVVLPTGTRRRVDLAARHTAKGIKLGLHRRFSEEIEDLSTCLLLLPSLRALLAPLRTLLGKLLSGGAPAEILATATESGIDLLLTLPRIPSMEQRQTLAAFAEDHDLARISTKVADREPDLLAARRTPVVRFGGVAVTPPPGGFLQPTAEGEKVLVELVLAAVPPSAELVADLFSGCGTFTLPLAQRGHRVHALEGFSGAVAALETAKRQNDVGARISVERRDLERRPLTAEELEGGQAVVFDPPRAGAKAQSHEIAASSVPCVVAVSCNPTTFARDARTLVSGGYRLEEVTPVDQFPWTSHLELVARFVR